MYNAHLLYMIWFCQLFTTLRNARKLRRHCIWYDFVSYSQPLGVMSSFTKYCIWYDFVSYSQRIRYWHYFPAVLYDFISYSQRARLALLIFSHCIWYDLSAIHNIRNDSATFPLLCIIRFFSYVKERRCKDKEKTNNFKI